MKMDIQEYMDSDLSPEENKANMRKADRLVKLTQLLQRKEKTLYEAVESYNDSREAVESARDDFLRAVRSAVEEMGSEVEKFLDVEEFSLEIPGNLKMPDNSPADRFARYFDLQHCIEIE
jgi:hypothetical protein